jgi:DNA-binding GntR family transcriptional regulator
MPLIRRAEPLVDQVTRAVRDMIVQGEFVLGERLSENALATRLGVSITPVREAFALLKREGLVEIRPQRGTFVFELQQNELNELCDARTALEVPAMKMARERNGAAFLAELDRIVQAMKTAQAESRILDYLALDADYHRVAFAHCDNGYLRRAYALIDAKMAALRNKLGRDPHHMRKSMREHEEILRLLRKGDLAGAEDVLLKHIARKEGSYWQHFDPAASARE